MKHHIHFTGLYSTESSESESRSLTAKRFPTDVLTWYQSGVAENVIPSASRSENQLLSQMVRLNYNFNSKYLLTFTARRDGYSSFGKDNKFAIFPSIALGWNISEEKFLSMDWIDYFKLRVSYGEVGNQAIGSYSTLARLQEYNYLRGDNAETTAAGYGPGALANNNLRWETTVKLNYGFDFQIINSRISGAIDIYETHTHDLLLDRSISSIHGVTENFAAGWQAGAFTSITSNIGEVKNTGFDLSISSKNIQSPKFLWETKLSVSHNKNQIIDLYGNKEDDIANKWFIGKSIDTNFDYVFDGVWQIGDDYSLQPEAEPGIVKIKDTNNDGKIDADDRSFIGHSDPSYIIGFENTISYQNFTLSMFFNSQLGATKYNQLMETDIVEVDCRRNTVKQNWWREDNPTNDYPRNSNYSNPYAIKFYQNASFLRLRDVTLSYVFSDQTIKKIGVKNLRIYGNITNALTFTKWEGLDPELGSQIANPLNRTFSIGLNIGI